MSTTEPAPCAEARAYLASLPARPPVWERDVADVREEVHAQERAALLAADGDLPPMASIEDVDAAGVPARLYRPVGGESDVLVWIHGGAWMWGLLEGCEGTVRALASGAGCAVLSVGYRLAPEHRFPAAVEDAWAATRWALERFERVAVGGESAGANLAAVAALRARDRGIPLALQLLVCPLLDADVESPFFEQFVARYARFDGKAGFGSYSQRAVRHVWDVYAPDVALRVSQDAAPLRASTLAGVAPAVLITAEHDILRGQAEDYARRLEAEGVAVESHDVEGQIHGFYTLLAGTMWDAKQAFEHSAAGLRRAFAAD
jgi:acetyl esterase